MAAFRRRHVALLALALLPTSALTIANMRRPGPRIIDARTGTVLPRRPRADREPQRTQPEPLRHAQSLIKYSGFLAAD
jgi:hypothetical protein